jgi:hypothetical protein
MHKPRYPIYIISKGRADTRFTSKALEEIGVPYRIVVEPQEYDAYAAVISPAKILTLPFSNLGLGGIPARNWVWNHSIAEGHARHWIMDDNIMWFCRYHLNKKIKVADGACFAILEDIVDRYQNAPMAGIQYEMFVIASRKHPPVLINTRCYSCILLSNAPAHRYMWRGRYNEDTDLSLRFLKDGYCTILLQSFLCKKIATMRLKGGNTESLYKLGDKVDGRLLMAQSLMRQHPDVTTITRKWDRWQHVVDYRKFKANKLILRDGVTVPQGHDDYGLELTRREA